MSVDSDIRAVRELRVELAQALAAAGRLDEAYDQFVSADQEPGDTPSSREIERQTQRVDTLRRDASFASLLDEALAQPAKAVGPLTAARQLLSEQRVLSKHARLRRGAAWPRQADSAIHAPAARLALHLLLGDGCLRSGRYDEAQEWYRRAAEQNGALEEAMLGAAEAAYLGGDTTTAASWLERMSGRSRREQELRARVLHAQGDHAAAGDIVGELVEREPSDTTLRLLRGSVALALADPHTAAASAEAVIADDPNDIAACALLTQARCAQFDWEEASKCATKVLRLDPTGFDALLVRAQALLERGSYLDPGGPLGSGEGEGDGMSETRSASGVVTTATSIGEAISTLNELGAQSWTGDVPLVLARALAGRPTDFDLNFLAAFFLTKRLQQGGAETDVHGARLTRARGFLEAGRLSQAGAWVSDLEATILDLEGDGAAAAEARLRAGERFQDDDDHQHALKFFEEAARSRNADRCRLGFLQAESLLNLAWGGLSYDRPRVEEGVRVWREAFAIADPPPGLEWAYITFAQLLNVLAEVSSEASDEIRREAVAHLEVGVAARPDRPDLWPRLADGHIDVGVWCLGLEAAQIGLDMLGEDIEADSFAVEQVISAHASLDHWTDVRELTARFRRSTRAGNGPPVGQSVEAYQAVIEGRYDDAERMLTGFLEAYPTDRWSLMLRSEARRHLDDDSGALADIMTLTSLPDFDGERLNRMDAAWASYWLGRPTETLRLIDLEEASGSHERGNEQSLAELRGAALVASGSFDKGEQELLRALQLATVPRMLKDRLPNLLNAIAHDPSLDALVERIRRAAQRRIEELGETPRTAEMELDELSTWPGSPGFRGWGQVVADLARVRRSLSTGDTVAIDRAITAAQDQTRTEDQRRLVDYGLLQARRSLAVQVVRTTGQNAASCESAATIDALEASLPWLDDDEVVQALQDNTPSRAALCAVDDSLRATVDTNPRAAGLHARLIQIIGDLLGARDAAGPMISKPLGLLLGSEVIPEDTSNEGWSLFTEFIPSMREQILRDTGVEVPGVRVSTHELSDTYSVLVDGVSKGSGAILAGWGFVLLQTDELLRSGIPADAVLGITDPLTGEPASRVRDDVWQMVPEARVKLCDPVEFAVRHLAAVVRQQLGRFVDPDLVRSLLEPSGDHAALRDNGSTLLRFTELCSLAVTDGLALSPLNHLVEIFNADKEIKDHDFLEQLRATRSELRTR